MAKACDITLACAWVGPNVKRSFTKLAKDILPVFRKSGGLPINTRKKLVWKQCEIRNHQNEFINHQKNSKLKDGFKQRISGNFTKITKIFRNANVKIQEKSGFYTRSFGHYSRTEPNMGTLKLDEGLALPQKEESLTKKRLKYSSKRITTCFLIWCNWRKKVGLRADDQTLWKIDNLSTFWLKLKDQKSDFRKLSKLWEKKCRNKHSAFNFAACVVTKSIQKVKDQDNAKVAISIFCGMKKLRTTIRIENNGKMELAGLSRRFA